MGASPFVTFKDLEELLQGLECDSSPDELTRISKIMFCIYLVESGFAYETVERCVVQLQCSVFGIGLEDIHLEVWRKLLNVTMMDDSLCDVLRALPGFCAEHCNTVDPTIDFNAIVNSALPALPSTCTGLSSFVLQTWWNVKSLQVNASRYCQTYIGPLHNKWLAIEEGKRDIVMKTMESLNSVPVGVSVVQQVEKLLLFLMLQDDVQDWDCNLMCLNTLITGSSCNGILSHINVVCSTIQTHCKPGKASIAYSTAEHHLREAATNKASFPQRSFPACSPVKIKKACTCLSTFVTYAWKDLKKVQPQVGSECLLYATAIAQQWCGVSTLKRKSGTADPTKVPASTGQPNREQSGHGDSGIETAQMEMGEHDTDDTTAEGHPVQPREDRETARPKRRRRTMNHVSENRGLEAACAKFKRDCLPITSFCSCCKQIKQELEVSEPHDMLITGMLEGGRSHFVEQLHPHKHGIFKFCKPCNKKLEKCHDWNPPKLPFTVIHPAVSKCNKLEAALLAAVVGFQRIVSLPSTRQRGIKGHVISVPNSGQKLENSLPNDFRPTVFYKCHMLRRLSDQHTFKDGYVRIDVMIAAAKALLETPLYQGFSFDIEKLKRLAADFPEVDDEQDDMCVSITESHGYDGENDSVPNEEDVDELTMLQVNEQHGQAPDNRTCLYEDGISHFMDSISNLMVPPVPPPANGESESQSGAEAIEDAGPEEPGDGDINSGPSQENGNDGTLEAFREGTEGNAIPTEHRLLQEKIVRIAPAEGNRPIYCWQDNDLQAKMFPQEFGGFPEQNPESLSRHEMYKMKMLSMDRRFARNPEIIFYLQREAMIYSVFQCANMSLKKGCNIERLTVAQARDPEFIKKVIQQKQGTLHMQQLRTSPDYMKSTQHDFVAMFRTLGIPTFFVTVWCADTKWEQFLQTLYFLKHERLATPTELETMPFNEKCELLILIQL
jgi:hypothetical protein